MLLTIYLQYKIAVTHLIYVRFELHILKAQDITVLLYFFASELLKNLVQALLECFWQSPEVKLCFNSDDCGKCGGARRDRTADLLRARQALSQLSYGPFLTWFFSFGGAALVVHPVTYISTLLRSLQRIFYQRQKFCVRNIVQGHIIFADWIFRLTEHIGICKSG